MNERFNFDKRYSDKAEYVIGTDEAGRGPGAGPVFAAAVCFKTIDLHIIELLDKLNDSKKLEETVRKELYEVIIKKSVWCVHSGSVEEIEKINILNTSLLTMKKSVEDVIKELNSEDVIIIVDGNKKIPKLKYNQETIIKGDIKSASIAAASIIAKVERDKFMENLDKEFPQYGWRENKGYMTAKHLEAVDKYGLTKWHRKKFFEKHFETSVQLKLM